MTGVIQRECEISYKSINIFTPLEWYFLEIKKINSNPIKIMIDKLHPFLVLLPNLPMVYETELLVFWLSSINLIY